MQEALAAERAHQRSRMLVGKPGGTYCEKKKRSSHNMRYAMQIDASPSLCGHILSFSFFFTFLIALIIIKVSEISDRFVLRDVVRE